MKKLYEIVTELEAELATCSPEDYPRVCVELCRHLGYVDKVRTGKLLAELLNFPNLENHPKFQSMAFAMSANSAIGQLNSARAYDFAQKALEIATRNQLDKQIIHAQIEIVNSCLYSNKIDEALDLAHIIHVNAIQIGDKEILLEVKNMLVHVYLQHDHSKAGEAGFEAIRLATAIGKGWILGYSKFLLGYWAMALKDNENVPIYFKEAKALFEEHGCTEFLIASAIVMADYYSRKGLTEQAIAFNKEILQLAIGIENERHAIGATYSIGRAYLAIKDYKSAEPWFLDAISLAKKVNNPFEEASASSFLATLYEETEQDEKAIQFFERATIVYGSTIRVRDKMAMSNHLHKLYAKVGNHQKAYEHLSNFLEIKLKLQDEARIKETTKLQQLYEKEKRETDLRELTIKQQQTELQQAESELKAIRAQMNPHFIFNALNTIQSYIYLNDKQNASNYLGKFSRLTRMILDMSNHEVVSLKDELEALTLYLQLERMRFEEVLTFNITVADALDTESIKLPAMLIQPYIENAIKHGLLHKKDNRELHCSFELKGANLIVCIDDNGIGRQRSLELNATKGGEHKSFATQANAKRFSLLNKNSDDTIGVVYTDKTDADGRPTGTLVVLTIPVQFDGAMALGYML